MQCVSLCNRNIHILMPYGYQIVTYTESSKGFENLSFSLHWCTLKYPLTDSGIWSMQIQLLFCDRLNLEHGADSN